MYKKIINELNRFLNLINVSGTPLNPDAFQAVLVKKLSNQNIIKDKRRINAGDTVSTVNQTHIDVTSRQGMLFFFEKLNSRSSSSQSIDIDLFAINLRCLHDNNESTHYVDPAGNTYFIRKSFSPPPYYISDDSLLHSSAYKKYGHTGEQVQINIPDSKETFTQLQRYAFQDDALVMLRYDYLRYVALIIPYELCATLYSITNTHGNQNINYVALNPSYNSTDAYHLQQKAISKDVIRDDFAASMLQTALYNNPAAGTDIEKIVKTRISQGSFRRLLLLKHHSCSLCDITTTSVLRASHIKEWSDSTRDERIDENNGLLLCANHDSLFDRHLISFEPNTGKICISKSISNEERVALNLSDNIQLTLSNRMKSYMQLHYKKFIDKENI